jgi:CheY-like chemotaxis protein
MRLRMTRKPVGRIDGVALDQFHVGEVYELGTQVACVFLAEGWAEVADTQEIVRPPPEDIRVRGVVLVVDDDPSLRALAKTLLTCQGYHVVVAEHGEDGIRRLRECCPDVIVLDLNMPVMDGWQFRAEQQRLSDERLAAIPVVLLTAADHVAQHAATLKARAFIPKPFDPIELMDAIDAAVPHRTSAAHSHGSASGGDRHAEDSTDGWRSLWRKRT